MAQVLEFSAIHVGEPNRVPGSWLQTDQALALVDSWEWEISLLTLSLF